MQSNTGTMQEHTHTYNARAHTQYNTIQYNNTQSMTKHYTHCNTIQ